METHITRNHCPWNKGKLVGQNAPLKARGWRGPPLLLGRGHPRLHTGASPNFRW